MDNKENKQILHGNSAKIKPEKNIVPRFTGYVVNDNITRNGGVYNRLADDAEFCKKEVDNNEK